MHYYQFNIGDYYSHTQHLDDSEDLAYRRMLDWCYLHESPLPDNVDQIAKFIRMRTHSESITVVLHEFFELGDYGWFQKNVEKQIDAYKTKSEKAKASANARWHKEPDANALPPESECNANHKPLTKNHKPNIPYQLIVDAYHNHATNLPKVELLTDKRKTAIRVFWNADKKHQDISFYEKYFRHVNTLNFLIGNVEASGNRSKPWKAKLVWLLNIDNLAKIIEGDYNNE